MHQEVSCSSVLAGMCHVQRQKKKQKIGALYSAAELHADEPTYRPEFPVFSPGVFNFQPITGEPWWPEPGRKASAARVE